MVDLEMIPFHNVLLKEFRSGAKILRIIHKYVERAEVSYLDCISYLSADLKGLMVWNVTKKLLKLVSAVDFQLFRQDLKRNWNEESVMKSIVLCQKGMFSDKSSSGLKIVMGRKHFRAKFRFRFPWCVPKPKVNMHNKKAVWESNQKCCCPKTFDVRKYAIIRIWCQKPFIGIMGPHLHFENLFAKICILSAFLHFLHFGDFWENEENIVILKSDFVIKYNFRK